VIAVRSASDFCVLRATSLRALPTFVVSQMKNGIMNSDSTVSCHDSNSMATRVEIRMTTLDRMLEAVSVITDCTPPTSLEIRDWISPVRAVVKNRSGMCCRWR
jgi:hypothetical protein